MVSTKEKIEQFLFSQGISQEVETFVNLVSNCYHKHEAEIYDAVHLEIEDSIPFWRRTLEKILDHLPETIRVLDIGCGTGFASEQVLKTFSNREVRLTCQDISPEMLSKCNNNLRRYLADIELTHRSVDALNEEYDLVITNAVLHHLIDIPHFLHLVGRRVKAGGFYIAGHEPNASFYTNPVLYRWLRLYRLQRRLRRLLRLSTYMRRLGLVEGQPSIAEKINQELLEQGIIGTLLPSGSVQHLVDIHVPPAVIDSQLFFGQWGINPDQIPVLLGDFIRFDVQTYAHLKEALGRMDPFWRAMGSRLASQYPFHGAQFIMTARKLA